MNQIFLFSKQPYILEFIKPFVFSILVSLIITPITIFIYRKFGWLDDPAKKKHPKIIHQYPVPRGGGIPIYLAILLAGLIFLPLDKHLIGILIGGFLILIIGIFLQFHTHDSCNICKNNFHLPKHL